MATNAKHSRRYYRQSSNTRETSFGFNINFGDAKAAKSHGSCLIGLQNFQQCRVCSFHSSKLLSELRSPYN
ncbi:hypothetical protein L6452_00876 [Arctium lappa]|uniref:Uncharacterized protein n=2 Tax=Arctium lappa TaxID=4217 RepID=A0ACB9FFI9_ARCLA|nr:hypothetical protein L6452_00874 [Arctium lappa]KAI3769763.1 hypothetical protein L6452_00876 [Arctium lappa]